MTTLLLLLALFSFCNSAADCDHGMVCGDTRMCSQLCTSDKDCPAPSVCGPELGYCGFRCRSDAACAAVLPGSQCVGGSGWCWYTGEP